MPSGIPWVLGVEPTASEVVHTINALGEAQRETRLELARLRTELRTELRSEVGSLRTEMRAGFTTMHTGMTHIVGLLGGDESPAWLSPGRRAACPGGVIGDPGGSVPKFAVEPP